MAITDFEEMEQLVKFGKFLMAHLSVPLVPEKVDWNYILSEYTKTVMTTIPGLMYTNWVIATYYNQDPAEVRFSKRRKQELTRPRRVAQYIMLRVFGYRPTEVKRFYEMKQHGTISSNANTVENEMQTSKILRQDVEKLILKLTSYEEQRQDTIQRSSAKTSFGGI